MRRDQVVGLTTRDAILQFVQERGLPWWYAGEIMQAEEQNIPDEEIVLLYDSRVAAATLEYRQWEGAM